MSLILVKPTSKGQVSNINEFHPLTSKSVLEFARSIARPYLSRLPLIGKQYAIPWSIPFLSPEIVVIILEFLLEEDDLPYTSQSPTIIPSTRCHFDPLVLLRVSSYWRNVALSRKSLWKSVLVVNPGEREVQKLNLWMDIFRSATGSPADQVLELELRSNDGTQRRSPTTDILRMMLRMLPSTRSLKIHLPSLEKDRDCIETIYEALREHRAQAIHLESIHLFLSERVNTALGWRIMEIYAIMASLPQMKEIKWKYKSIQLPSPTQRYDWLEWRNTWTPSPKLKVVELRGCHDGSSLYRLLSCCPNVEVVILTEIGSACTRMQLRRDPALSHRKLKELVYKAKFSLLDVFDWLTLPNLKKLDFQHRPAGPFDNTFPNFLQRSQPPLTHFIFHEDRPYNFSNRFRHDLSLMHCCKNFTSINSTLEHLGLWAPVDEVIIFDLLERENGNFKLFPSLKYLDLGVDGIEGGRVSDLIFLRAAVYKKNLKGFTSYGSVEKFTLWRTEPWGIGDKVRIEAMDIEGVHIKVQGPPLSY